MRKIITRIDAFKWSSVLLLIVAILLMLSSRTKIKQVTSIVTIRDTVYIVKEKNHLKNLTIQQFKDIISVLESGNDYSAVSKYYFGKYQISQTNIALSDYDVEVFMGDKEIQEDVMDDLMYEYLYHTATYCNKYNGTKIFDLEVDMWTILYGCHCAGYPKVKKWLDKPSKNRLYRQMLNFNQNR